MQIFTEGVFRDQTIDHDTDKRRPHIQEVKTVKAMCDDEQICREGFCVGFRFGDEDHQIACESAQPRVEERACQTSEIEIIRYQFGGRG